jgi:hypothetical protein
MRAPAFKVITIGTSSPFFVTGRLVGLETAETEANPSGWIPLAAVNQIATAPKSANMVPGTVFLNKIFAVFQSHFLSARG